jgi:AraC-like DNA-binding protein
MSPDIMDFSRKIRLPQTITYDLIKSFENNLSANDYSLTKHSAIMGISPKKLQRLLRDEGTSFSQVLENFRACKALQLLHETNLPIKTIATNLGYSSSESFNTACKRWFQKSPRRMRQDGS